MIRFVIASMFFTLVSLAGFCQAGNTKVEKKARFTSINQIGLLTGQRGQAGLFQTINGITKDKWFAGIGAGFDYYGSRSIPLFIDVRREVEIWKNSPFIYFDGGIHLPYATDAQNANKGYIANPGNGLFLEGGLGFKLKLKSNNALLFSAGYSYKKVTEKAELINIWSRFSNASPGEYYTYQYRRIVLKVGIEL